MNSVSCEKIYYNNCSAQCERVKLKKDKHSSFGYGCDDFISGYVTVLPSCIVGASISANEHSKI